MFFIIWLFVLKGLLFIQLGVFLVDFDLQGIVKEDILRFDFCLCLYSQEELE